MGITHEIYLTKKYVLNNEWQELIKTISNFNGFLRKWQIIITNDKNQIRYYVKTKCNLPSTINNLNSFLLKQANDIIEPAKNYSKISFPKIGSSLIDLINYTEIKNKGKLIYLKINFIKLYDNKIKSKIIFYLNKNDIIIKYNVIFALPTYLLSIDFEGNKRYFYKSLPKYLDINKVLHLLDSNATNALLKIDTFPYLQGVFYLNQNSFGFAKHSLILGSSGCGKSKLISLLIDNIYQNNSLNQNYKVVVIDPHAALEYDIGGLGQVIDFKSIQDSIDLFINNSNDITASTELLLALLKNLITTNFNFKLERVLRHSIYILLTAKSFNFKNLRKLILDLEYRSSLIKTLNQNLPICVIDFFLTDFNDLKTKSYSDAISPIISFIDEMEMLPVFSSSQITKNLQDTIDSNFLTIFSLDRTKLGDKVTKTISGLIMGQLLSLIESKKNDKHIIFIIDEVAIVENSILCKFLAEARKYNLSLILASQYFSQISNELQNSIFANVINYFIFRVSKLDATTLVDNFNMKIPLDDTKESKIKLLTELNNRECLARIEKNGILLPAFKAITIDYISKPRKIKNYTEIKKTDSFIKGKTNFNINTNVTLKDILLNKEDKKGCDINE